MQVDGVRHNLGMHETEIEAARAYDKFARVSSFRIASNSLVLNLHLSIGKLQKKKLHAPSKAR